MISKESSIPTLYEGSVKNVLGPVSVGRGESLVFEYTDAYSVFDWGRMPDFLHKKGQALAFLAADLMEKLESPQNWEIFFQTETAKSLLKASREKSDSKGDPSIIQELRQNGLRTHFQGMLSKESIASKSLKPLLGSNLKEPMECHHLLVQKVEVVRPDLVSVMGKSVYDYSLTRSSLFPKLIPLEVVFRFSCPPGSSLPERMPVKTGDRWDYPILEVFTKLESSDRALSFTEALAISGVSPQVLEKTLQQTAWVAGFLKEICQKNGLELADGKLEWGLSDKGDVFLVDAIGPDELRILKNGLQLSKEFLRSFYRKTPWYESVQDAKKTAREKGVSDWKSFVRVEPPSLPPHLQNLASELYQALANCLSGRNWFPNALSLREVLHAIDGEKL